MADRQPTMQPIPRGHEAFMMIYAIVDDYHHSLQYAEFLVFFDSDKPVGWWGSIKPLNEEAWWLGRVSNPEFPVDIIVHLNGDLWGRLQDPGKLLVLDSLLAQVTLRDKVMTYEEEGRLHRRLLYERTEATLGGIRPEVLARNPDGVQEIDSLRKILQALTEPEQFLLEFEGEPVEEGEGGGEDDDVKATLTFRSGDREVMAPLAAVEKAVNQLRADQALDDFTDAVDRVTGAA